MDRGALAAATLQAENSIRKLKVRIGLSAAILTGDGDGRQSRSRGGLAFAAGTLEFHPVSFPLEGDSRASTGARSPAGRLLVRASREDQRIVNAGFIRASTSRSSANTSREQTFASQAHRAPLTSYPRKSSGRAIPGA